MALYLGCFLILVLVFQCGAILTLHFSFQTESRAVSIRCKEISSAYWKFALFTLELFVYFTIVLYQFCVHQKALLLFEMCTE